MTPQVSVAIIGLLGINAMLLGAILRTLRKITSGDIFRQPLNSYGEGIGEAIQGQLVRGMAGIDQYEHLRSPR